MTKRRPYPADIQLEVEAANREGREVALTDEQLASLGHAKRNPIKVIRGFCLSCMGGNAAEVRRCTSPGCKLFPYRFGSNPFSGRRGPAALSVPLVGSPIQDERAEQPADSSNASKAGVS
jgi:hypothetical protein